MSNAAPIGIDDRLTALKNKSLIIDPSLLLANDSDPDGEILSLVSVQSAVNGVVSVQNGQIVFVPTTGYLGAASFTYTITDNVGGFVTATVKVNVVSVLPKPAPTLDTIFDDVLQQVGNVAPNGYTNDTKPTFGGTGVAGDIVKIMDGGKAIGSATVDKAGNWTFTPKLALAEGPHTITVQGKTTDVSSPRVFTVDTKAPLAPILNSVDDNEGSVTGDVPQGGKTDDTTPTFGGTGEPGSVITVKDGTTVLGTTTVDSGGTWSLTPATPLADGLHSVTATATDKAGNTSPATAPRQFTVDTKVAVPTPTIDGVNDDVGPITGNVPANGSTNDNQPTFSGSAGPGSVVTVRDNGVPLGSATAGADGKWSLTPVTPLVDGPHSVTAQAGPGGPESAPRPFTIDTKPPGVPLVFLTTDLNDDGFILADELSLDGGRVSVSVELPKDAQVGDTLLLVDQGGVVVQRVLTATDLVAGTVEIPGAFAAPADGQTITVQANLVDKAGNVSGEGLDSAVIKLGKPPAAPTIDIVQDDVAPVTGDVPANGSTNDNRPTFSGSADPNSVVIVKDNGVPIGSTTAGPTGIWSLTPVTPLADGPHSITAQAGPGGPESAPRPFTVDTKAPVAPTLDGVNDDVAPVTGDVPPNGSTNDNRPTFSGTAEPNSVVTVKDGGVPIGTVTVGPDGKWSLTPVTPLADGPHSVTAQATDKAGNTGPESAPRPFTVDTKAPVAPTLDGVNDDVAPVTGDVPPNGSTNDNRPTFSGTAEPNSVVTVKDGGVPIGTVTAGPDGKWSLTPVAPLADGPHSVTAQATDKAGNTGPDSAPRPFTVDTKAPIAPTLDTVNDDVAPVTGNVPQGGTTDDTTPTFAGTAEPNSVVTVKDGPTVIGSTTADPAGNWSLTPVTPLANGPHSVTATATDKAGNESPATAPRDFTIDTRGATGAPTVTITEDTNNDGFINDAELNGPVGVRIALPAGAQAGDSLEVFTLIGDVGSFNRIKLTAANIAAGGVDLPLTPPVEGGRISVSADIVNSAGASLVGSDSATRDTKAPVAPTLNGVNDDVAPVIGDVPPNGTTNDNRPTFSGNAEPGSVVTVKDGGVPIGSTTAGPDGTWSLTPVAPLADGPHSVTAQATDKAGNTGPESAPRPFTVDTKAPNAPTLDGVNDDVAPVTGNVPQGGSTNDNTPTLTGTGEPGSVVTVKDGPTVLGSTTVNPDGTWSLTPTTPLADGPHSVTATAKDPAGNEGPASAPRDFTVDTKAPNTPTLDTVDDNVAPVTGNVPQNGTTDDTTPTFGGTGEPASVITVKDGPTVLGSTTVNPDGTWSLTPTTPLANGPHSVTATATDKAGNESAPTAPRTFTIDATGAGTTTLDTVNDDVAPVTGDVPPNGSTNDNTPTFGGTAKPGSVVTVSDNGTPIGSTTAKPDGTWSLTPVTPLADGPHSVTAQAKDPAGNEGPASAPRPFTVDTQAPNTPTLDTVNDDVAPVTGDVPPNGSTNDNKPTFGGTAEPNSVVTVKDGPTVLGSTTTGPDGKWSLTPVTPLADGPHSVTATATDAAGNTSPATTPRPFTVDTVAPNAPTLDGVNDDVAPVTGNVPQGGSTNDNTPTLTGTGEPGSLVTVKDGPTVLGSTTVNPDGTWSLTPTTPLADGPHSVTATAKDPAGNEGPASAPRDFTVDTKAPNTPTLDTVDDNVAPVTGNVPQNGTTDDTTPTFGGTGEPASVITVKDGPTVLGSTTVNPDGTWSLTPTTPLANGPHSVTATATDKAGNESAPTAPRTFTIDVTGAGTTTLDTVNDDVAPVTGDVPPNGSTNDNTPTFGGTAKPGSVVTVSDNGTPIGSTTAKPDGTWSLTPVTPLADGPHSVTAQAKDPAGNEGPASAPRPFTVDTQAPNTPTLDTVNDDVAPVTGDVPPNGVTNDNKPTFSGTAEPNSVVTVKDGPTVLGSTTTGPDGKWSLTPVTPLADGPHSVTATATDAAGNTSPATTPRPFTVDTVAPNAPTLDSVNDDVAPVTGDVPPNGVTNDNKPTFSGTAEPNSVVTVKDGPTVLGSTTTGPDGKWSLTPVTPLAEGPHSVTATATDPAGNESPASGSRPFTVDTQAPSAPVVTITSDVNNDGILSPSEQPNGVDVKVDLPVDAKTGDKLTITDQSGAKIDRTLTDADIAATSVTLDNAFPIPAPGTLEVVKAVVTDAAGNQSPEGQDSVRVPRPATGAPVVEITEDANNDGFINKAELNGLVGVKVSLPVDAVVGDIVKLNDNAAIPNTFTQVLTAADIAAKSVSFDVPAPVEGATLTVTAVVTNSSGVDSPSATDSAKVDTTAPGAPTVTITSDANNDGILSPTDQLKGLDVKVGLPTDAEVGDLLTVTDQSGAKVTKTLTATDLSTGSVSFDNLSTLPTDGKPVSVTATVTDVAGNVSLPGVDSATVRGAVTAATGKTIFQAYDSTHGTETWITDGTTAGTFLLKDIIPGGGYGIYGANGAYNDAHYFDAGNGKVLFQAYTPESGFELWTTDGTEAGTQMVKDIYAGSGYTYPAWDGFHKLGNGQTLFTAYTPQTGRELWVTDGTNTGTHLVKDIYAGTGYSMNSGGYGPAEYTTGTRYDKNSPEITPIGNGKALFQAYTPETGYEVYITDGTDVGTHILKDINPGSANSYGGRFEDLGNGKVLFGAETPDKGYELWVTDGTEGGTQFVKDIYAGTTGSDVQAITAVGGGKALFWATTPTEGQELWITDGTTAGTTLLKDIYPGTTGAKYDSTKDITPIGNGLYLFSANDGTHGTEIWVTDLTSSGTHILKDIYAGSSQSLYYSSNANNLAFYNDPYEITAIAPGWAVFQAYNAEHGADLWVTNGQDAWVVENRNNIAPYDYLNAPVGDPQSSFPNSITAAGDGNVIFTANSVYGRYTAPFKFDFNTWKSLHDQGLDTSPAISVVKDINGVNHAYAKGYVTIGIDDPASGNYVTPIAVDLNGDGIQTTALGATTGKFDLLENGQPIQSGWLSGNDGFLAVDSNGNGVIDSRAELFGGQKGEGFAKLAEFDSNQDGVVNAADARFGELKIWQDLNQSHTTDAGELKSLTDAGVKEVKVSYADEQIAQNGNILGEHSSATLADGTTVDMIDVYFRIGELGQEAASGQGPSSSDSALDLSDVLVNAEGMDGLLQNVLPEATTDSSSQAAGTGVLENVYASANLGAAASSANDLINQVVYQNKLIADSFG